MGTPYLFPELQGYQPDFNLGTFTGNGISAGEMITKEKKIVSL